MKKIIAITAMAATVAAFSFGVDFSATANVDATLLSRNDDGAINGPTFNSAPNDKDVLSMSVSGEKAGASVAIHYHDDFLLSPKNSGDSPKAGLYFSGANIWFKPIDMLKISVGNIENGTYAERINWWHATVAESVKNAAGWGGAGRWKSATLTGTGAMVDLTVGNLSLNAGIAPGATPMFSSASGAGYGEYGVAAKYTIMDGLTAAVSFRDTGKGKAKILRVGADYSNGGLYAFENVVMNIGDGFNGIAFDTYVQYSMGALTLQASLPVVIRLTDAIGDDSYMLFDVKASYSFGAVTPFIRLTNTECFNPIVFAKGDDFAMDIRPGVGFSIGECSVNVEADFVVGKDLFKFSVPVSMSVSL